MHDATAGELRRTIAELPEVLERAGPALDALNQSFPPVRAFAREILPGVRATPDAIDASFPWIRQVRALVSPAELQGLVNDLRPAIDDLAQVTDDSITELVPGQVPSTKSAKAFLTTLTDRKEVLVVIGRADETGALSVRNLPGVHVLSPDQLNTYDVLKADDVVFSVEALHAYIEANTKHEQEVSA